MARKKNTDTEEAFDLEAPEAVEAAEPVESVADVQAEPEPKPEPPEKTAPAEAMAYIGPNLPGGKLFQYAVFRNGLPVYAEKLVDECGALKFLFVPVSRLSVARIKLGDKTSVEAAKFAEASRHFEKGAN